MKTQVSLLFVAVIAGAYFAGQELCHMYAGGGSFSAPFGGVMSEDQAAGLWGVLSAAAVTLLGIFVPQLMPVIEKFLPGVRGAETLNEINERTKRIEQKVDGSKSPQIPFGL